MEFNMNIDNLKKIRFLSWWLAVFSRDVSEPSLVFYRDYRELKIMDFMETLVKTPEYLHIFNNYCSQCGNCCKREAIVFQGGEIFPVSTYLGMTEKEFYLTYLKPCSSWSSYDGFLKLSGNECPFLEKKISGRYFCKIYEYRPLSCRSFHPSSDLCKKEPADLIEQISSLDISNNTLSIDLHSHGLYNLLLTDELMKKFRDILTFLSSLESEKTYQLDNIAKIVNRTESKLEDFLIEETDTDVIEHNNLFSISFSTDKNFSLDEIFFSPVTMGLFYHVDDKEYNYFFVYPDMILSHMKNFIKKLAGFIKENFSSIMNNIRSACYMCGDCCVRCAIEVDPSDIYRISENLNITPEEVREKYMTEGYSTWNSSGGLIKKVTDEFSEKRRCIFLERTYDNKYYCSIHQFKPGLCRKYTPGNSHCYRNIKEKDYYRLVSNIQNLYLNSGELKVETKYTCINAKEPLLLEWRKYDILRKEIEIILESLKEVLNKNYFSEDFKSE
jgi:Fe-S-cluster containining protein